MKTYLRNQNLNIGFPNYIETLFNVNFFIIEYVYIVLINFIKFLKIYFNTLQILL